MKKKNTILIVAGLVTLAGLIALVSAIFGPAARERLAGTMGNSDAAGSVTLSAKDAELKKEFTKDTIKLRGMIQGLTYFGEYNEKMAARIGASMQNLENHPLLVDKDLNRPFIALREYCNFLVTSSVYINSAEVMLQQFRSGNRKTDQPVEITQTLYDLGSFINQVAQRDNVLEEAAIGIDQYLDKREKKITPAEANELKKFRNQLLVDNLMTAAMLDEKTSLSRLYAYANTIVPATDLATAQPATTSQDQALAQAIPAESAPAVNLGFPSAYGPGIIIKLNSDEATGNIHKLNSIPVPSAIAFNGLSEKQALKSIQGMQTIKNQLQDVGYLTGWNYDH